MTGLASLTILASMALRFSLLPDVNAIKSYTVRDRDASDQTSVWSLISCRASGRGRSQDRHDLQ